MTAPDLSPPPGCTPFALPHLKFASESAQFLGSTPEDGRVTVRYFKAPEGGLLGRVWFGPRAEGPPGHAHGGAIAAVLDEVMGGAAWLAGHPVMTASMSVHYRRAVPLGRVYTLRGHVKEVDGRKVHLVGELCDDDTVYDTSTGVFIVLSKNPFKDMS
jgi:acyl-coenzyme A thioesterase PaaI-like protein